VKGWSLGGRIGGAANSYKAATFTKAYASDLGTSLSMNVAAQGTYTVNSFFDVQGEFLFTADEGGIKGTVLGYPISMTGSYQSLLIPILAKFNYRTSQYILSGFLGPYFSLPLGDGKVKTSDVAAEYLGVKSGSMDVTTPMGFILGVSAGKPAKNGILFGDLRFAWDAGATEFDLGGGDTKVLTRSAFLFSVGYEVPVGN
jgi:hypothetical protein